MKKSSDFDMYLYHACRRAIKHLRESSIEIGEAANLAYQEKQNELAKTLDSVEKLISPIECLLITIPRLRDEPDAP